MRRRDFLKNMIGVTGASALALAVFSTFGSQVVFAEERRRKRGDDTAGTNMVDPKEGAAKAVQYVEASNITGKNCANCVLYVKTEIKNNNEIGTCALFPKKLVFSKAHCGSWAKKA